MSKLEEIGVDELATALYYTIDAFGLILVPNHWSDIETDWDDVTAIARHVTGREDDKEA